jgi:transcriptional regulator with XRE-family HTH domain
MSSEEVEKLMRELTDWCKAEYGRQRELARALGVTEQVVSHWLTKRSTPTLEHGLHILTFLEQQRKNKPARPKEKQPKPKGQRQLKGPSQKANSSLAPPGSSPKGIVSRPHRNPSPDHSV